MHATLLSFLGTAWIVRVSLVGASCIAELTAFGYEGVHPCSRVTCLVAAGALTGAVSTTAGVGRWHLMFLTRVHALLFHRLLCCGSVMDKIPIKKVSPPCLTR